MQRALVLTTASKANTTGGTFADSLTANAGDTISVFVFQNGGARILEAWAIDSDSVAELQWIYTRPEATHDQQHGVRFSIAALVPGGAAAVGAKQLLPGLATFPVYSGDTPTLQVSTTAADDFILSYVTEYDNLPGVSGSFATWEQVQGMRKSTVGVRCSAVASGTPGLYGTQRAINADDARFHAGSWYAILGASVQTPVTSITLLGPDWGGQRIGLPAGAAQTDSTTYFVDQATKWHKPMIPCFAGLNAPNVLVQVADAEASTSGQIDFLMYELSGPLV